MMMTFRVGGFVCDAWDVVNDGMVEMTVRAPNVEDAVQEFHIDYPNAKVHFVERI